MTKLYVIIVCLFSTWTVSAQTARDNAPSDTITLNENGYYSLEQCKSLSESLRGGEVIESLIYHKNQELKKQVLDTLKYVDIIIGLATSYIQIGDIISAQKETDGLNQTIGFDNIPPEYAWHIYQTAGIIAYRLQDYPKALKLFHSACKIIGKENLRGIEYAVILSNIGLCYKEIATDDDRYYLKAKWYIDESISVFENKVGPLTGHGAIGLRLLNNKALLYENIGDRNEAIETLEKIVSSFSGNIDVEHEWFLAVNNLSTIYLKMGQFDKCISMLEQISFKDKELQAAVYSNLLFAYYLTGNSKLKRCLEDYNNTSYDNCLEIFKNFTEAERENYWTNEARELMVINNLVAERNDKMADIAYDNLLFVKNLKLMSSGILKDIANESGNQMLRDQYNKICELRDAITYNSNMKDSISIWSDQLKEKERNLLNQIPDYKERLSSSFHKWEDVKHALDKDEIAIEFTYYLKMSNILSFDGYYAAMIVTSSSLLPEFVVLCNDDDLDIYSTEATADILHISSLYNDSVSIYQKIWCKLEPYLKGKKTIYFSPTGQLNLLNHSALITPDGTLFGDKYNLVRLSSTDKILSLSKQKPRNEDLHSAIIYGGIVYDLSVADMTEAAKKYRHSGEDNYLASRSEDERGRWNYLPNTMVEAQNIYDLLFSRDIQANLLQGSEANEESFKSFSGKSPNIIHLSTHGFFLNSKEKERANPFMSTIGNYSKKEDQLIRTGLLMAGANNVWCGKEQVSGIEDGILTADEISRLDLSNTDLVVLSACETAKGKVDEVDGVLGLQRGFKKAGVNTIVMSLWKVPDQATSILMTSFYEHLLQGKDARNSLKEAQKHLMHQNDGYRNPYYWAAFVVLD